jgi:hypothetical protein
MFNEEAHMRRAFVLVFAALAASGCVSGDSVFYALDPKSSFVMADMGNSNPFIPDQPDNPLAIPVAPGETLTLIAQGLICWAGTNPNGTKGMPCYGIGNPGGQAPETQAELGGVFSADPNLLGPSNPQRLPDAISSGLPDYTDPYYTTLYFHRDVSTVNPFDFQIPYNAGVTVVVPAGAHYLYLGVYDSYYKDNTDPSGTLGIDVVGLSVPEPGTLILLLAGLGGLSALRRR